MKRKATWFNFDKAQFAIDVKAFREGRGLSCRSLAKSVGVSAAKISRLERELFEPDVSLFVILASMMNKSLENYIRVDKAEMLSKQGELF